MPIKRARPFDVRSESASASPVNGVSIGSLAMVAIRLRPIVFAARVRRPPPYEAHRVGELAQVGLRHPRQGRHPTLAPFGDSLWRQPPHPHQHVDGGDMTNVVERSLADRATRCASGWEVIGADLAPSHPL